MRLIDESRIGDSNPDPWRHVLTISEAFGDACAELLAAWQRGEMLQLWVTDDETAYVVRVSNVTSPASRDALSAAAQSFRAQEWDGGRNECEQMLSGRRSEWDARARCQGPFMTAGFDDALAEATEEQLKQAAKKRRRRLRYGLPVAALRGRAKRKADARALVREGKPDPADSPV